MMTSVLMMARMKTVIQGDEGYWCGLVCSLWSIDVRIGLRKEALRSVTKERRLGVKRGLAGVIHAVGDDRSGQRGQGGRGVFRSRLGDGVRRVKTTK